MRGPRLIHLSGPSRTVTRKNGKALFSLSLAENDDVDALNVRSIKNSKSLLEWPTITAFLLLSAQKRSIARNCWNRTWLAGTGLSIFAGKPTGNVMVKYLTQHMAYGFISCTSDFFYLCSKQQTHCTYAWQHKDIKAQRLNHAATCLPRM